MIGPFPHFRARAVSPVTPRTLALGGVALWPDLQHDLASGAPARDPRQRLAHLIQRQHRLDLRAQPAGIDQAAQCLQPLPVHAGGERFAGDAALQLGGRTGQDYEDRPAAVADRTDGLVPGLGSGAVQQRSTPPGTAARTCWTQSAAW